MQGPSRNIEYVYKRWSWMPTLTPAQHRKVHALLEPRTLDAARNIFRFTLGLDPDQVSDDAMNRSARGNRKGFLSHSWSLHIRRKR